MQKEKKAEVNTKYEPTYKELMEAKIKREWDELPPTLRELADFAQIRSELYGWS